MRPVSDVAAHLAWAQLWQVTLVITVAALVTRLAGRNRPHLAHLIWLVVLIKSLTPPLWSSPTGLFSWTMPQSVVDFDVTRTAAVPATSLGPYGQLPNEPVGLTRRSPDRQDEPTGSHRAIGDNHAAATAEGHASSNDAISFEIKLAHWLLLAWAIGALVSTGCGLALTLSCGHAIRRSRLPSDQALAALVIRLSERLALRRKVRLVLVSEPMGPMTFGWLRPTIVVPQALTAGRSPAELEPLVAHELVHVRRGDALVGLLQFLAQCVWWFHPLVWWANREIGREREWCCDEEVVAGLACLPATYARSLLDVLELKRQLRWLGPLPGLRRFEVTKQRLERIMTHSTDFHARMPRGYWLLLLAGVLLLAPGARLATRVEASTATAKSGPNAAGDQASAAALVQGVYDRFEWVERVRSFHIRAAYTTQTTAEALSWDQEHPLAMFGGVPHLDPRPFHVDFEWAWDETRIRYAYQNSYEGDSAVGLQTRVWDGSLAVACEKTRDQMQMNYVLDKRMSPFFSDQYVTHQFVVPWGPGGPYHFWWLPTDVAHYRQGTGVAPDDFAFVTDETVNGRQCHVLGSRIAGCRLDVGVADGRLYRRTTFNSSRDDRETDLSPIFQRIAGPDVKTYNDLTKWLKSLGPDEQARAAHQLVAGFAERSPRDRIAQQQDFEDYREVAPGCWLPFRQSIDTFSHIASQPFLESHADQQLTEVAVNQPLAADLFHVELQDGVPVTTDRRYDPAIRYTYRKDQTEAERLQLRDAEQKSRAKRPTSKQLAVAPQTDNGESSRPTQKTVAPQSPQRSRMPRVIESVPKAGLTEVSADLKEIKVTFDRDMQQGMSWTGGPPYFPPVDRSRKARWINPRTCVLPVTLEKGRFYRVGFNAESYRNFRSAAGLSAPPSVLCFATEDASEEVRNRVRVPHVVDLKPAIGAKDLDPATSELRVTFDVPMAKGMSWTGSGRDFPKSPPDSHAEWSSDGKTCTLPVVLEPGHSYRLGLNSVNHNNFQSEPGVPLEPVIYQFQTR
jgi:beta-lactamase regulating signal transducer with metallopeptidase domain